MNRDHRKGPLPGLLRLPLTAAALAALVALLGGCAHGKQGAPPPTTGGGQTQPSQRFDGVGFKRATIKRDDAGSIVATLGIGVDVVGTLVADPQGNLAYEQHPVMFKSQAQPQPLSPADRASLAANLQKYLATADPATDPLWQQLLTAAQK